MNIIAFDPGKRGGIAWTENGSINAIPMPQAGKEFDLATIVKIVTVISPRLAVVEKVHAMPGEGVTSMFSFGMGYGMLHGIIAMAGIRLELVPPQTWKKVVLQGTTKDKDATIAYCRRAFPNVSLVPPRCRKEHDGIADALCILEYGRRSFI